MKRPSARLALPVLPGSLLGILALPGCETAAKVDFLRLIGSGRDGWQRPERVIEALELKPGDRVAEIGAGDGYWLSWLSRAVGPAGRVYAVEVEADKVAALRERVQRDGLANVEVVFGRYADPLLPDAGIDTAFTCLTYHHIEDREAYFARLRRDLAPDARLACFEAYNNAALEFAAADPKRLLPVTIAPVADVDETVREVTRLAKRGARAILLPLYPVDMGLPHYSDKSYDSLWSCFQETGIPISQHVSANQPLLDIMGYDATPAKGIFQSLPPIFMAEAMAGWIVPGTLARFPDLRIVLVESGLGWLPYFLERLDTMSRNHGWHHYKMLPELPSTYFRRQMFCTFEGQTFGVSQRPEIGIDNLV